MTSDEVIVEVSEKKQFYTRPLLQVLKNAAVDCIMNRVPNENEAQCFAFTAIRDGQLYTPDYKDDITIVREAFKQVADKSPEELGLKIRAEKKAAAEIRIGDVIKTVKGIPVYAAEKVEAGVVKKGQMYEKDGKRFFKWEAAAAL